MTEPSPSGWSAFHAFITNIYPVFLIAWSLFLVRLVAWTSAKMAVGVKEIDTHTRKLPEATRKAELVLGRLDRITADYSIDGEEPRRPVIAKMTKSLMIINKI